MASAHPYWNPGYEYVKLCQARYLTERVERFASGMAEGRHLQRLQLQARIGRPSIPLGGVGRRQEGSAVARVGEGRRSRRRSLSRRQKLLLRPFFPFRNLPYSSQGGEESNSNSTP